MKSNEHYGPSEWLDLLVRCQNGETTCMKAMQIIERETVSMDSIKELHAQSLELCYAIEALPGSPQQTELSIKASAIAQEMQRLISFEYTPKET